jgi:hypothetical protein
MSPVERFTRDGASKYVWAVLALVALLGLAYAITAGGSAVDDERAASQARAVVYVDQVLAPRVQGQDLAAPISGIDGAVRRSILSDTRVSRVRIWSADGTLLFSTDGSDRPGSHAGLNDPLLRVAEREGPITRSDFSDSGGQDDPERSLLRTYVPLGPAALAEVDQTDEGTVGPVRTEWLSYQILAGGLLLLLLVMIGLSLREPIEPINVGVPFADSSIPAGFSLIDDDRLHAVHEVYRLASERVARLQEKLEESEGARRKLEGQIQQALSKAGANAPRPAAASAPPAVEPPAPAPAPPAPEPTVVKVPESDVVVTSPHGGARAAAPAGPLARAARDQKTVPVTSRKKKPAAPKPRRAPKKPSEKLEPQKAPPEAAKPRPAPDPEPKVAAAVPAPVAKRAPQPARPAPAPVAARAPQADEATAHAAALETFIRLTESDRQPHDTTTVDQGAVRAALARTAARKKPGGERLQLPDTSHDESLGDPSAGSE